MSRYELFFTYVAISKIIDKIFYNQEQAIEPQDIKYIIVSKVFK